MFIINYRHTPRIKSSENFSFKRGSEIYSLFNHSILACSPKRARVTFLTTFSALQSSVELQCVYYIKSITPHLAQCISGLCMLRRITIIYSHTLSYQLQNALCFLHSIIMIIIICSLYSPCRALSFLF
jgi:hypothetical protein